MALVPPEDLQWRAEALRLLGGCYLETDDLDRGARYMQEALEASRTAGDRHLEARLLHNLAYSVLFVRGEFLAALRMEEGAARICEDLEDITTLGFCLIGLAHIHLVMGHHRDALTVTERLLRLCEEWHAEPGRGYALEIMADTYRELGDIARARRFYEEAVATGERLEEPTIRMHALNGLALLLSRDDPAGARALAGRALELSKQMRSEWFRGRSLMVLGAISGSSDSKEGIDHLREAVRIFEQMQARYDLARAHLHLAAMLGGDEHRRQMHEALTLGERGGYDALFLHTEQGIARPLLMEAVVERVQPDYAGRLLVEAGAGEDLLPLLGHANPAVRAHAARLAAEAGERRATRGLQRLLRDRDPRVREASADALERLSHLPPPLRVCLLGPFKVFRAAEQVLEPAWKRSTAKTLLQYLVSQRPKMTPEEAILEALWPGAEPESAHAAFHAALHALRKALEPDLAEARDSTYILGRKDQYYLNPRVACWVDAEEFERLARLGRSHEQRGEIVQAIAAFLEADGLYAGDYLEESPYQEWAVPHRERLRQIQIEVLLRLGGLLGPRDAPAAIDAFRRAIVLEPYCEPAYRGLMRMLAATGCRAEALQQYQTLERHLQRDLQVTPSSETTDLYRDLVTRDA